MKTYVVGDIHGNWRGLKQAIDRSPFDPKKDRLITIGDLIDGGNHIEVPKVLDYLLSLPNWIGIKGNHDVWLIECLRQGWKSPDMLWYMQGGKQTFKSLGIPVVRESWSLEIKEELPERYVALFQNLRLFYADDKDNVFVHAGWTHGHEAITDSYSYIMGDYSELYWTREFWDDALKRTQSNPHNKVFIGHTALKSTIPEKRDNIWNVDTGAGGDGKITIMDVDTEEYWQSDRTHKLYGSDFGNR